MDGNALDVGLKVTRQNDTARPPLPPLPKGGKGSVLPPLGRGGRGGRIACLLTLLALSHAFPNFLSAQEPKPAVVTDDVFSQDTKSTAQETQPAPAAPRPARQPAAANTQLPAIPMRLDELIRTAGWVMIPIIGCSFIAVAFGFERLVMLRRRRVIPRDFVTRFVDHLEQGQLNRNEALLLCEENGSPVADMFAHGVRKWGRPSVEVEQAIIDGGERQVSQLRKNLRILNAVATISPLLGLLGTVIGMIESFNSIAQGSAMGKPEQLAGGVGMALINTAGGLAVAIPALILYMYFAGRIDALVMEMDLLAQKVVNLISAEGLANPPAISRPPAKTKLAATTEPKEVKKAV